MEQVNITLSIDSERLEALEFYLQKERSSVQKRMDELLRQLYEDTVPDLLREYLDRNAQPGAKLKRQPRPNQTKPTPAVKQSEQTISREEESHEQSRNRPLD